MDRELILSIIAIVTFVMLISMGIRYRLAICPRCNTRNLKTGDYGDEVRGGGSYELCYKCGYNSDPKDV